jgi:hypothetical protein
MIDRQSPSGPRSSEDRDWKYTVLLESAPPEREEQGDDMMYNPKPIDINGIVLSDDLIGLTEILAENAHDIWATRRMRDGWTYGPKRDDTGKKHPDLVPYKDLPESEKEYDRKAAMDTLKAIISMGYRIDKKVLS